MKHKWVGAYPDDLDAHVDRMEYLHAWYKRDTRGLSHHPRDHPAYVAMVALGWFAVPWLLRALRDDKAGYEALSLLHEITGYNPIRKDGTSQQYFDDWVSWGVKSKLITRGKQTDDKA